MRELQAGRYADRPSDKAIEIVRSCLQDNPLALSLVNWAEAEQPTARLYLKWPGSTASLRTFAVDPLTNSIGARDVFFTRRDVDETCKVKSYDPLYAPLMWPLALPYGEPLVRRGTGEFVDLKDDHSESCNMRKATLAMLLQPARDENGACLLLPTRSPYSENETIHRRFSPLEKMGKLGEEILLDRHLAVHDQRLHFLQSPAMQNTMLGQFQAETDDDVDDQSRGTYLPPTEVGSPRYLREKCADALSANRTIGKAILFITMTTDLKDWPEIWTRLPLFENKEQNAFDRSAPPPNAPTRNHPQTAAVPRPTAPSPPICNHPLRPRLPRLAARRGLRA